MAHWILLPILLPALLAPLILMVARHDIVLARVFSSVGVLGLLWAALALFQMTQEGQILTYALGNWPAPFGIVLVADRLAALMLLVSALLAIPVLLYAMAGHDRQGSHFHALYLFQWMGINGAFLTGDLFNLFVFFEILLIASYALMVHGGGKERLRAGVQYVIINLAGSSLFLIAIGLLYALTGTLNMADLAVQVAQIAPGDQALLRVAGVLLLLVFSIKAALVPVHFWLPRTYAQTSAPVAALFAIMTKVGAYAIIRVYTLVFGDQAGDVAWLAASWLLPLALLTVLVGSVGLLAAKTLGQLGSFAVLASMGILLSAIGLFSETALGAALYYLLHSTWASAAFFLLAYSIAKAREGRGADGLEAGPLFPHLKILGIFFVMSALALTGLPPLSGFLGKLWLLLAAFPHPAMPLIWGILLLSAFMAIVAFARAGSALFWAPFGKTTAGTPSGTTAPPSCGPRMEENAFFCKGHTVIHWTASGFLMALLLGLTLFAGPISGHLEQTAQQVFDTSRYTRAVLGDPLGLNR
jgi:multicomponent K+:H+ antiporter subunit D